MNDRLVIFDFDGTLADSMAYWLALPFDTLRDAGLPAEPGFAEWVRAHSLWEAAQYLTARYPELAQNGPLLSDWHRRMAENYERRVTLRPGAAEFLELLRERGVPAYMLSATARPLLDKALARFGLADAFERIITEDELGCSKRLATPYLRCLELAGVEAERACLFEDLLVNLRAAGSLGIRLCAVRDAGMAGCEAEVRALPGLYIEDFRDRPALWRFVTEETGPA